MIREQFINRIQNVYGEPTRVTKKINAWHIFTKFGFVVEVDTPRDGSYVNVWLPKPSHDVDLSGIEYTEYPEDKGRHSNTYGTPGLFKGEPALKIKLKTVDDFEWFFDHLAF
ncbi:hypothetical protein KW523_14070 [Vibrio fluvialis]|nr:hypothetical protein [Vibrio fluvialis]